MGGWKNVQCVLVMEFIIEFIFEFPLKWNKTGWQWETESIYLIPRMNFWLWELVAQGWCGLTSGKWDIICRHGQASPTDRVCSGVWVDICRHGPASPSDRECVLVNGMLFVDMVKHHLVKGCVLVNGMIFVDMVQHCLVMGCVLKVTYSGDFTCNHWRVYLAQLHHPVIISYGTIMFVACHWQKDGYLYTSLLVIYSLNIVW